MSQSASLEQVSDRFIADSLSTCPQSGSMAVGRLCKVHLISLDCEVLSEVTSSLCTRGSHQHLKLRETACLRLWQLFCSTRRLAPAFTCSAPFCAPSPAFPGLRQVVVVREGGDTLLHAGVEYLSGMQ